MPDPGLGRLSATRDDTITGHVSLGPLSTVLLRIAVPAFQVACRGPPAVKMSLTAQGMADIRSHPGSDRCPWPYSGLPPETAPAGSSRGAADGAGTGRQQPDRGLGTGRPISGMNALRPTDTPRSGTAGTRRVLPPDETQRPDGADDGTDPGARAGAFGTVLRDLPTRTEQRLHRYAELPSTFG